MAQECRSIDQVAKTEGAVIDIKTTFSGSFRGSDPELNRFGKMVQIREAFRERKYRESTKSIYSAQIGWPWKETTNGSFFHLVVRRLDEFATASVTLRVHVLHVILLAEILSTRLSVVVATCTPALLVQLCWLSRNIGCFTRDVHVCYGVLLFSDH